MGNELLSVLNTVMAAMAAAMNLWGALRTSVMIRRSARVVVALVALYVGAIYTAYLLDLVTLADLGSVYLRPALLVFLTMLAILPAIDLLDPVERLRTETSRTIADLSSKYELLQEQMTLILERLAEAQTEVRHLRNELTAIQEGKATLVEVDRRLVVAVGDDGALDVDLAALRAVKTRTGLSFMRLKPATKVGLKRLLDRQRMLGMPIRWLQLSLHMGHEGAQFADGIADGVWLSEQLAGVEVLMLAGCSSDFVGDDLGVVPHVVSVMEDIGMRDAAMLSEAFWGQMALGATPREALNEALDRTPPAVEEFVQLHEFAMG